MLTRLITSAFGLAALGWSLLVLPALQATAPLDGLAQQIVAGEAFRDELLTRAGAALDLGLPVQPVPASRARAAAVIRLRLVESALDRADAAALDPRMVTLRRAIGASLADAPADPFLWLMLYWLDNTQNGVAPGNLPELALSYALGPREGWIALRRNRLALAIAPRLDAATRDLAVAEFAAMVDARFIDQAADNLAGPGWPLRDRLVASLAGADIDPSSKQALAKYLYTQGITLPIPGVPDMGERPWR